MLIGVAGMVGTGKTTLTSALAARFGLQMALESVDGVMLPHHWARSIDGKPTEEMTFKTIKINPAFKADTFTAK